jgi:hypothetical protein
MRIILWAIMPFIPYRIGCLITGPPSVPQRPPQEPLAAVG